MNCSFCLMFLSWHHSLIQDRWHSHFFCYFVAGVHLPLGARQRGFWERKVPVWPKTEQRLSFDQWVSSEVRHVFRLKCIKCILVSLSLWFSANNMIKTTVALLSQRSSFQKFPWIGLALCFMFYCRSVGKGMLDGGFPNAMSVAVFLMKPGVLLAAWSWRRRKQEGSFVSICRTFYRNDPFSGVSVTHNWKFRCEKGRVLKTDQPLKQLTSI